MKSTIKSVWLVSLALFAESALAQALAATDRCTSLTLYGNAANSGLCKSLSPATQNLQVCELANNNPDIHLTFSQVNPAATPLHLTVRTPARPGVPGCEGNVEIGRTNGAYVAAARNAAGGIIPLAPPVICGVNVASYLARLNAQAILPAGAQSACITGFAAALQHNRLSPQIEHSYLQACTPANAPPPCH